MGRAAWVAGGLDSAPTRSVGIARRTRVTIVSNDFMSGLAFRMDVKTATVVKSYVS
jgi:hypothetical protein